MIKYIMKTGIYVIENLLDKKKYIGSAKNIDKRWYQHKYTLNKNMHDNSYLQNAWNKYGKNNFMFYILEEVKLEILIEREQYYINLYNVYDKKYGYNLAPTAGNTLGFKFSNESKLKMSIAKKNKPSTRKNYIMSEETKKKISNSNKISQIGRKHSNETRNKMKKPHGSMSEETKSKIRNWRLGLIPSQKNGQFIIKKQKKEKQHKKIDYSKNRGENNGMSITNSNEVIAIRNDYNMGITIRNLQIKYNKNYMFIYRIVKNLRWNWLNDSSLSG